MKYSIALVVIAGMVQLSFSADYYVSALNGNDSSSGTFVDPFKTISKAATVLASGDRCFIREGIYRETVTVQQDNVWFGAYLDELVVISGCDLLADSWTLHSGNIMKLTVPNKVLQLFVKGKRMNLARYPNEDAAQNMLSRDEWEDSTTTTLSTSGTGRARVTFDTMTQPPGYWVGGYYSGQNGSDAFTAAVGNIVTSSSKTLEIVDLAYWSRSVPGAESGIGPGWGYIINHLNALDFAGEWYWDAATLYYYPEGGVNLESDAVEARFRLLGFVLDSRSNVVLENIQFHAASISMANAINSRIDSCTVRYPAPWSDYSYPTGHDYGGRVDGTCGLYISGSGNVVTNSLIAHSWGSGLRIEGEQNLITDCTIEDSNWLGRRMAAIQLFGTSNRVEYCTIKETGRDGIDGGQRWVGLQKWGTWQVMRHNRIENFGWLATDSGGFYMNMQGVSIPANCEFAYNEVLYNHGGMWTAGVFLDNGTHTAQIHHNLIVGPQERGIMLNDAKKEITDNILIANNTVWDIDVWALRAASTPTYWPTNIYVANNLMQSGQTAGMLTYPGTIRSNNSVNMPATEFTDVDRNDFRLVPGSPYIDSGIVIPGITDGYTGSAPDRGAYEVGVEWFAGSSVQPRAVYTAVDTDADTVPDIAEMSLGTDPFNPDTSGNGTPDGEIYQAAGQVVMTPVSISPDQMEVRFGTQTNWHYYGEYADTLESNAWIRIAHVLGGGSEQSIAFVPASSNATGFMRVLTSLTPNTAEPIFRDGFDHYSPEPPNGAVISDINTLWSANTLVRFYESGTTGLPADTGNYYAQFLGETGDGTLSFSILTEVGKTYGLSFAMARVNANGIPKVDLSITGSSTVRFSATLSPGSWLHHTYRFTATSKTTVISFVEPNIETTGQAPLLDSISVRLY